MNKKELIKMAKKLMKIKQNLKGKYFDISKVNQIDIRLMEINFKLQGI